MNSKGIALAHNLIAGPIANARRTTLAARHSTRRIPRKSPGCTTPPDSGDHRFYNNLFVAPCDLHAMDKSVLPCFAAGNVFARGSQPAKFDADAARQADFDAGVKLTQKPDGWYLDDRRRQSVAREAKRQLVTTELLGKAKVPGCAYENPDGTPLRIDTDYFGNRRTKRIPSPGRLKLSRAEKHVLKVWPIAEQ